MTANTKAFSFDLGMPHVVRARWLMVWTTYPYAAWARLVFVDGVTGQLSEIAVVAGSGAGQPRADIVWITDKINALIDYKHYGHLGFQIWGNGINPWTLHEVRLEMDFE
jgi:hypothetical protein